MSDSAPESRRLAVERDEQLPDIDWTTPPEGAVLSTFAAPSGGLATVSLGDPAHPRVVLVAGATGSKEDFHFVMPELVAAGYYVQSYDLAGQYESHAAGPWNLVPPARHYTLELFVDDMIAFIEAGGGPVHLLGYSFAGVVAQLVAVRRPELVASLTFLGTPPDPGQSFAGVSRLGRFSGLATPAAAANLMRWGVQANVLRVKPGRIAFVRSRFHSTRRDSHRDIMGIMMEAPDVEASLAALEVPKAVAVGEHDLWPLARHARFAEAIGASMHVYRTGHSPCEDAPYELSSDLLALYAKASSPGLPEHPGVSGHPGLPG
ncbi:alpha/beta hydrolase [Herbiconiux moechotypicola]|uniref:Alpha/beta hydrolase n=1 Tax=Herbiconiux moechotypicola TaxID=637393 RepID=A0ABN3E2U2_9MICO|nr:alpha/beta hydrolase [Herbiconiux moechotypicola]MCS5731548.1 alpha/beta hydrolase [Herbiconiux moechotypicola]